MKKLIIIFLLLSALNCFAESSAYRGLCIGIADYDDGSVRIGGRNSTQGVCDAVINAIPGNTCDMILDLTKDELISALENAFPDAAPDETVFIYINSHGGAQAGISWIETKEGGHVTAGELKSALSHIPGKIVLIIDCCNSGGFIGKSAYTDEFANGLLRDFGRNSAGNVNTFASSKYMVCVSSSFDQNSYRIASQSATEENMSTVFSRSLCEAMGWDLIKDRTTNLKADTDGDKAVTFTEMCAYTRQRCMYYLTFSSPARQSVQFDTYTSVFALAQRGQRR